MDIISQSVARWFALSADESLFVRTGKLKWAFLFNLALSHSDLIRPLLILSSQCLFTYEVTIRHKNDLGGHVVILSALSTDFPMVVKFIYLNECTSFLSFGDIGIFANISLLWKHTRAAAQDVLKEKQLPSLACTVPLFFLYNDKNLLLEIHTSVKVVIMCQRVWSGGGGLLSSWLNKN